MPTTQSKTRGASSWLSRHYEVLVLLALAFLPFLLTPRMGSAGYVTGVVGSAALLLNVVAIMLVYRVDGYLNFAQLQFGLVGAALFDGLNRGRFLIRSVDSFCSGCASNPSTLLLAINFTIALALGVIVAIGVSVLMQATVMQRMRNAPRLMSTVITVFIAQALAAMTPNVLTTLIPNKEPGKTVNVPAGYNPLRGSVTILGARVSAAQLVLVLLAAAAVAGLWYVLYRRGWGVRLRSVAANRDRAGTLGISANQVSRRAWAIAGLFSAIAALLPAIARSATAFNVTEGKTENYTAGIQVTVLVLMLTVVVFARFHSLFIAALAALVLGILNEAVQVAFGTPAVMNASYVVLVSLVLLARREGGSRVERDDLSGDDMVREIHSVPRELAHVDVLQGYRRLAAIIGAVAILTAPALLTRGTISLLIDVLVFALVALSVYVITGWAGYVSFGQFGFAALGGWVAAVSGLPFLVALPLGVILGSAASVLVGVPAVRLRGMYLAIATLAFALTAQVLLLDPSLLGRFLPETVRAPDLFGLSLTDERAFYYLALLITVASVLAVIGLRRSRFGRVLIALRSNPAAATSFGVEPVRARLTAFAVSGALAATGGVIAVFHQGHLEPEQFAATMSITAYLNTLVGGLGGVAGPLIGAAFYGIVHLFFSGNPLFAYVAVGLGAVLLLIAIPGGLLEAYARARDGILLRLAYRLRIPVPRLMGDGGLAASQGKALLDEKRASLRPPGSTALPSYVPDEEQWRIDPDAADPDVTELADSSALISSDLDGGDRS